MKGRAIGYAALATAAAMAIYGAMTGGAMPVLRKAVTVCLECVGIG